MGAFASFLSKIKFEVDYNQLPGKVPELRQQRHLCALPRHCGARSND